MCTSLNVDTSKITEEVIFLFAFLNKCDVYHRGVEIGVKHPIHTRLF